MSSQYAVSLPIRLPKNIYKNEHNITHVLHSSPQTNFIVQHGVHIFDPNMAENTPPNEFMNLLKERMNVYFKG